MEIELAGVSKSFGTVRALSTVDVRLTNGNLVLVEGPNGSGKTTLLKILATALAPDEGQYLWDGQPVHDQKLKVRSAIAFMGDRLGFYEDLTVQQNLLFWARLYDLENAQDAATQVPEILQRWGLDIYRHRQVRALSLGMLRRLGLAKVVVQNPRLVLLDEPFNGLDRENSAHLVETLVAWKDAGKIIVIATHQPEIIEKITDQHIKLSNGRSEITAILRELTASR